MIEQEGGGASRSTDPAAGSSAATDVSLREYFERVFRDLEKTEIAVLNRGRERVAWACVFGIFAWTQIQRRLEILNHENARLLQQQSNTVSSDTYKANEQQRKEEQRDFKDWQRDVDRDRTQSISREEFNRNTKTDKRESSSLTWQVVAAIVGLVVAAIVVYNFAAVHRNKTPSIITITVPTANKP